MLQLASAALLQCFHLHALVLTLLLLLLLLLLLPPQAPGSCRGLLLSCSLVARGNGCGIQPSRQVQTHAARGAHAMSVLLSMHPTASLCL
jgi:hypothetical protein